MGRSWRKYLWFGGLGAFSFWSPDVLLQAIRGGNLSTSDWHLITYACPAVAAITYSLVFVWNRSQGSRSNISLRMVLGIWVSGPLAMMVGASFGRGGFATHDSFVFAVISVIVGTILFPFATFMMATYDGSLFALLLTTALLVVMFFLEAGWNLLRARPEQKSE
jgi:hypothetical protein